MDAQEDLFTLEGTVLTLSFGFGVHLGSMSCDSGPRAGVPRSLHKPRLSFSPKGWGWGPGLTSGQGLACPVQRYFSQKCSLWLGGVKVTFLSWVPHQEIVFLKLGHLQETVSS